MEQEYLEEGMGESSSSPRAGGHGGHGFYDIRNEIYERLVESGNEEALSNPFFREQLDAHFNRLPASYMLDVHVDRAEDVILHRRILEKCADPEERPVFHARFLKCIPVVVDGSDDPQSSLAFGSTSRENGNGGGNLPPNLRGGDFAGFEPCSGMEDLSLHRRKGAEDMDERGYPTEAISMRRDVKNNLFHEIIFSSIDKPKLLSQLSALLSEVGLNICEAHVFSTSDGYCLDVFVVDGWPVEESDGLLKKLKETATRNDASWSNSSNSSASDKILDLQEKVGDSEIKRSLLIKGEKIASGSSGDLYRGTYHDADVAIKILKTEHLSNSSEVEFLQEIMILKSVDHENVVRFYGACTKPSNYCIVTEYITGGNLYDFLHKQNNVLELLLILKIAIGISKGMDYLHQNKIIHRDLKSANLLISADQVVKIADFGVARLQSQGGEMTAETGTYRWMAPEVINHKPYDYKADVFSFAIVLWELATSKVPYDNLTPLQAALGVRQGMRLEIPSRVHPRLSNLIRRCWDENPLERPSFSAIVADLEDILKHVQASKRANRHCRLKTAKKAHR